MNLPLIYLVSHSWIKIYINFHEFAINYIHERFMEISFRWSVGLRQPTVDMQSGSQISCSGKWFRVESLGFSVLLHSNSFFS